MVFCCIITLLRVYSSLTSINICSDNTNYSSQDGVLFDKNKNALIQYPIGNERTSYTIPDSVTSIRSYAFEGCTIYSNGQVISAGEGNCFIISNSITGFASGDVVGVTCTLDNYDLGVSREVTIA